MSAPQQRSGGPQNPLHQYGQSGRDVQHSKEDALNDREFELLLEGATELSRSNYYYKSDPEMVVYVLGRLGLRRAELVHLEEDWIDWREQKIQIPAHSDCDRGRGGQTCGDCRQSARQRLDLAPDDVDLTFQEACDWMWTPKTEAGVREVYYGNDVRAELYLERYFAHDAYTRFEASGSAVGRRVDRAAELADELDPDAVYPHALRATAATKFAAKLTPFNLKQIMGWKQLSTAMSYVSSNSESTARQLDGA